MLIVYLILIVIRINVTLTSRGDKNVRNFTDNSLTVSKPMLSKECYKDFYSMLKYCRHGYFHQIQGKKNTHTSFFLIYNVFSQYMYSLSITYPFVKITNSLWKYL